MKRKQDVPQKLMIEKGVPLPNRNETKNLYPLDKMEIGDSFFAPNKKQATITGSFNRHSPKRFSCRSIKDTESGVVLGVRVWRIA